MNTVTNKLLFSAIAGVVAGIISRDVIVGVAVFAVFLTITFLPIYVRYAKDNPQHYWFKRKMFGWGWVPVSWQGFTITGLFAVAVIWVAVRSEQLQLTSTQRFEQVILPFVVLIALFLIVVYKTGEKPKWMWGQDISKYTKPTDQPDENKEIK